MYDWLLHGGTVIDGSGDPRFKADVAIEGDRIIRLARGEKVEAQQTIDCTGKIITPGFVDVHNHDEGWLLKTTNLDPKTSQGITSEVLMSDGISYAPLTPELAPDWFVYLRSLNGLRLCDYEGWQSLDDYMSLLDRRTAQNTITQIPYANLRVLAAGWGSGPLNDMQRMAVRRYVQQGMEAGAVGISTGLDYVAQFFSTTDELVDAASAMAPYDGLYVTHVRYKDGLLPAVQEAVDIARRANVKLHVSHLKGLTPEDTERLLEYIDEVAVHEVDFSFDVYPYLPGSTMLSGQVPYEAWIDGPLGVISHLRDPAIRTRFAQHLAELPLERLVIAWVATRDNAPHIGQSLAEFVELRKQPPADALLDLLIEENLAVTFVYRFGDDRIMEPMLAHPKCLFGSDGIFFADGTVHPRVYGSAPRILGPMVRDRKLFNLEAAVRRLSGAPAERFGLVDRGFVREGAFADLVVFDEQTVTDRATFEQPHQFCEGISHVLVNGQLVIDQQQPVTEFSPAPPGRRLYYHR